MKKIQNYINGEYCDPISDEWLDNYNPSNGEVYSQTPNSSKIDVEQAYQAAETAFESWSNTTIDKRSRILMKIASNTGEYHSVEMFLISESDQT